MPGWPPDFRVERFPNPDNAVGLKRSMALGEPPLLLGLSVWAAVKDALRAVAPGRSSRLRLPAPPEEILLSLTESAEYER